MPNIHLHPPLTDEEMEAVTVVFHQYETGLREGTIYTKVIAAFKRAKKSLKMVLEGASYCFYFYYFYLLISMA